MGPPPSLWGGRVARSPKGLVVFPPQPPRKRVRFPNEDPPLLSSEDTQRPAQSGRMPWLPFQKEVGFMCWILSRAVCFLKEEEGPTAVEYAMMLALIVIVCIAAIATLGTNARTVFSNSTLNNTLNVGS